MQNCEDRERQKNSASLCLCVRKKAKNQATSKNNYIFFEFAIIFRIFAAEKITALGLHDLY